MRKLMLAAVTLLWASCGPETGVDETTVTAKEIGVQESPKAGPAPEEQVSATAAEEKVATHPEVQQRIASFNQIKDAYMLALKETDAVKIQDLNMQYMDWYQQTQDLLGQLKGAELNAFKIKLAEMNKEWEAAAEAAVR